MSFEIAEVENPFPRPPERFKLFTDENIKRLGQLRERTTTVIHDALSQDAPEGSTSADDELGPDELSQLEKPRFDWIIEGGRFDVYADIWQVVDGQPVPPEPRILNYLVTAQDEDKRPVLHKMLKSLLHRYYMLLGAVSEHIPVDDHVATPYEEDAMFMAEIAYSFMNTLNSFRPLQARATLEDLMVKQLRDRRRETEAIHKKCDAIEDLLGNLKRLTNALAAANTTTSEIALYTDEPILMASPEEVLAWASEVA